LPAHKNNPNSFAYYIRVLFENCLELTIGKKLLDPTLWIFLFFTGLNCMVCFNTEALGSIDMMIAF